MRTYVCVCVQNVFSYYRMCACVCRMCSLTIGCVLLLPILGAHVCVCVHVCMYLCPCVCMSLCVYACTRGGDYVLAGESWE